MKNISLSKNWKRLPLFQKSSIFNDSPPECVHNTFMTNNKSISNYYFIFKATASHGMALAVQDLKSHNIWIEHLAQAAVAAMEFVSAVNAAWKNLNPGKLYRTYCSNT